MKKFALAALVALSALLGGCAVNGVVGNGTLRYTDGTGMPAITFRSDILLTTPACQQLAKQAGAGAGMDCQKGFNDGVEELRYRAEALLREEGDRSYYRAYNSVRWDDQRGRYVATVDCRTETKYSVRLRCYDGLREGQQNALSQELGRRWADRIGNEGVGRLQVR